MFLSPASNPVFPPVHRRSLLPWLLALLLTAAAVHRVHAQAIADTPENRRAQAQRYLQATPPKELFADMAKNMSASMPAAQRDKVTAMFTTNLDLDAITKGMEDALVKRFTAEELKAMADFYGSPVGKSVMSKMGEYSADLMPLMQAQMMRSLSGNAPGK